MARRLRGVPGVGQLLLRLGGLQPMALESPEACDQDGRAPTAGGQAQSARTLMSTQRIGGHREGRVRGLNLSQVWACPGRPRHQMYLVMREQLLRDPFVESAIVSVCLDLVPERGFRNANAAVSHMVSCIAVQIIVSTYNIENE